MKKFFNLYGGYKRVLIIGWLLVIVPFLISLISTLAFFPYSEVASQDWCKDISCINIFFEKNFSAFKWFNSWIGLFYNLATIFGIFVAVLTYKQSSDSNSMTNHFNNLDLFVNYVSSEILKLNYLHISNFDLIKWYSCVYENSKKGSLTCSDNYISLINRYYNLIEYSNTRGTSGPRTGFNYKIHQEKLREIVVEFGVDFEESSRTGFREIEEQFLFLLDKVNFSFVGDNRLLKMPIVSYK